MNTNYRKWAEAALSDAVNGSKHDHDLVAPEAVKVA